MLDGVTIIGEIVYDYVRNLPKGFVTNLGTQSVMVVEL